MSVNTASHHMGGFSWPSQGSQGYRTTPLFQANDPLGKIERRFPFHPFGAVHAGYALGHMAIRDLRVRSGARIIAVEALSQYPLVRKINEDDKLSEIAIQQAVEFLTREDPTRFSADVISRATRAVKAALAQTYEMAQASPLNA